MSNILDQWRVAYANAQNTVDGQIVPTDHRIHAALYSAALFDVGGITIHQREGRVAGVQWRYGNTTLAVPVLLDPTPRFLQLYRRWLRLVPRPLRDWVYNGVARHRYRIFGRREECLLMLPGWRERFLS